MNLVESITDTEWKRALRAFRTYLKLEKQLSDNSIDAYLRDVSHLAQYAIEPALRDSMPSLLATLCLTPDTLIDSLITRLPSFTPLSRPRQTDADAALQWLRGRGKVKKNYTADSLIYDLYGN